MAKMIGLMVGHESLIPMTDYDLAAMRAFGPIGTVVRTPVSVMRNGAFFRKWWVLVDFAFKNWEPKELEYLMYEGQLVEKNFEQFREDVTKFAGHFKVVAVSTIAPDGTTTIRVEKQAKSIAWANMAEHEFAAFYSSSIDAIMKHFLNGKGYTPEILDQKVNQLLREFT
jgi:hypothetical protein